MSSKKIIKRFGLSLVVFFIIILFTGKCSSQENNWMYIWNTDTYDHVSSCWVENNDIFLCGVNINKSGTTWYGSNGFVAHCDKNGTSNWNFTWDTSEESYANDRLKDIWVNGEYVYVCGETLISWEPKMVILKIHASNGTIIWNKTISSFLCFTMAIWGSNEYLYLGGVDNDFNYLLLKINESTWDIEWNRTWGLDSRHIYNSIEDIWVYEDYIYTCGAHHNYSLNSDFLIVKWDSNGNEIWNHTIDGGYEEHPFGIWGDEHQIVVVGSSRTNDGIGVEDIYIASWYHNGTLAWNTIIGGNREETASSLYFTEYNILISGSTKYGNRGKTRAYVARLDKNGRLLREYRWGINGDDGCGWIYYEDGFYYLSGTTNKGEDNYNIFLQKTDEIPDNLSYFLWFSVIALIAVSCIVILTISFKKKR